MTTPMLIYKVLIQQVATTVFVHEKSPVTEAEEILGTQLLHQGQILYPTEI